MKERGRKPRVLILAAVGLMVVAVVLLYVTAPAPTVLMVEVIDIETGERLTGADVRIRARSEQPPPIVTTDDTGIARFDDLPPGLSYVVRVQRVDYDLAFEPEVAVPGSQETQVTVPLVSHAGGRLIVGLDQARVVQIDTASLLVMQTIRLPSWKQDAVQQVRLHPEDDLLYAVFGNEASILDSQSGASVATFEVKDTVMSLSTDGMHLFVVTGVETGETIARQSNDSSRISVMATRQSESSGQLLTRDAYTGELLTSESTVHPQLAPELVWRPGGSEVYVIEPTGRTLWVLDANPLEVVARVKTGAYPEEGFLSADGAYRYLWTEDSFENLRSIFGVDMRPVPGLQALPPGELAWALSLTGENLYVLDTDLGTLSIVDLTGQEPPILVAVGKQPVALALSPDGQWAFVANGGSHTISVIHMPSITVLHTIELLGEPFSLAVR